MKNDAKFMVYGVLGIFPPKRTKTAVALKEPEVRRMEILEAAKKLFAEKGFSNTPVEAIIKKAGIAKGTFYYYFKIKNDILSALVELIALEMETYFRSISERKNLTAINKLKLMIRGPETQAIINTEVMKIIHKPENRELQEQLNIKGVQTIAPILAKVIDEGNQKGVFKETTYVETMQLILAGSMFMLDSGLFTLTPKKRQSILKSLQKLFEQLTGAKTGSLSFITKESTSTK